MNRVFYSFLLAGACFVPALASAADVHVRPGATGRNDGSDWTNAYTKLPTTLTRGDTYYLANGSYGSYVFNTPNDGSKVVTVKKATEGDHGSAAGWSGSYGDGQAVFTKWQIYTDYYVFDGQRRNGDWATGAVSQYGIRVAGTSPVRLDNGAGVGGDNLTFRYIDVQAGGRDTGNGDDVIYGLTGNSNITFQYCALHDSDRVIFLMRGNWQNLVVDHTYMARNTSTPAIHGELLSMTDSTNVVWSNNVMEDIEGTGFIVGINGGTASNWKIFGNVFQHTGAYAANTGRKAGHNDGITGVVYIANDASNNNTGNNFLFYNNTMINLKGLWSGVIIQKGSGNEVKNNIWYNSVRTNTGGATTANNWYYNTTADGDSASSKVVCAGGCDIFKSIAGNDFALKVAVPGGVALGSQFGTDGKGLTRGSDGSWDRGAYEFNSSATAIQPPTNLTIR